MRSANPAPSTIRGIHRFAALLAVCVVLLIAAGGLVKSLEAGLSVPDWPLSYGSLNPPRWWQIENVRAEHGHRLIAGTVAALTVLLAVWIQRREDRKWVKRLGWTAVAAVLAQALLGGLTVLFFLPTPISVSHAALAQAFLCLVVTLAVVTSRAWFAEPRIDAATAADLARPATLATVLVYLQILLGATVRHTGAGLAIPDFPLAFGRLVPPHFDLLIGLHYAHRVGAVLVTGVVLWTLVRVLRAEGTDGRLRVTASVMGIAVVTQFTLGALVVLTGRQVLPNTLHVPTGAVLLASCLILALDLRRQAYQGRSVTVPARLAGEIAS